MDMLRIAVILILLCGNVSAQTPIRKLLQKSASGSICDADATAFLTITGITDPTESAAACQLVKDFKDSSLWNLMDFIGPMLGGTSTTCKYNLKDPQNTDAAFRLTFSLGWTFSSTGALPNGSTSYAETHYTPSVNGASNSSHISYYSRTAGSGGETMIEMGSVGTGARENQLILRFADGMYFEPNSVASGFITAANTDARGYFIASRGAGGSIIGQKNTSQITGTTTESLNDQQIYIGARNNNGGAVDFPSNRECAFITIGAGLTSAQMLTLNFIVEKFQDALGRGVQ